jgi:hypothetical protein
VPCSNTGAGGGLVGGTAVSTNINNRWRWGVSYRQWPLDPRTLEWDIGWASELVWMIWRREKSAHSRNQTIMPSLSSLVTIQTTISQFLGCYLCSQYEADTNHALVNSLVYKSVNQKKSLNFNIQANKCTIYIVIIFYLSQALQHVSMYLLHWNM